MSEQITIKSLTKHRARLYSKHFTKAFLLSLKLENYAHHVRINEKCKSIIIYLKEPDIDKIIFYISSLLPKKTIKLSKACSKCCEEQKLKQSAFSFGVLSIYTLGIFATTSLPPILTLSISLIAAVPLLKEAMQDLKKRKFSLQAFMSFSLIGACFIGEINTAFEVIYILRGGMLLEQYASNRSKQQIQQLLNSEVKQAFILIDDLEVAIDVNKIKKGDIIVARSGEKIVVDGVILQGKALIDEALINGRSEPCLKQNGDKVYSNTLVQKGRICIQANAIGSQTYISKIAKKVEFALENRSEAEKQADILASKLLKLGFILTSSTLVFTGSILRAFCVMIVMSCPCATILAASTAISAGIAKSAKEGILIKGGEYLEKFSQSEVICFDKTGTLTTGKLEVQKLILNNIDAKELLFNASLAEYRNTHPIAVSIVDYAKKSGINIIQNTNSEILLGLGVKLHYQNDTILVGNKTLMSHHDINIDKIDVQKYFKQGKSVIFVAKNQHLLGAIILHHEPRDGIKTLVENLKKRGVKKVVLITGDDEKVAKHFAKKFNFDETYANILPKQKAKIITKLKKQYKIVSMVGDGINDTIAMSSADVGIAFSSKGSEAAVEICDIAIINSNINDVLKLHDISNFSLKVVKQNYYIGTGTNLLGVGFASAGLLSPIMAGALHVAHTIAIMANASKIALKTYQQNI